MPSVSDATFGDDEFINDKYKIGLADILIWKMFFGEVDFAISQVSGYFRSVHIL